MRLGQARQRARIAPTAKLLDGRGRRGAHRLSSDAHEHHLRELGSDDVLLTRRLDRDGAAERLAVA